MHQLREALGQALLIAGGQADGTMNLSDARLAVHAVATFVAYDQRPGWQTAHATCMGVGVQLALDAMHGAPSGDGVALGRAETILAPLSADFEHADMFARFRSAAETVGAEAAADGVRRDDEQGFRLRAAAVRAAYDALLALAPCLEVAGDEGFDWDAHEKAEFDAPDEILGLPFDHAIEAVEDALGAMDDAVRGVSDAPYRSTAERNARLAA